MNKIILSIFIVGLISGCSKCNSKKKILAKWSSKVDGSTVRHGDNLKAQLNYLDQEQRIDSVVYSLNSNRIASSTDLNYALDVPSLDLPVGSYNIKATVYFEGRSEVHTAQVILVSDIHPRQSAIGNGLVFPHSKDNFTEGFFVHNGMIYESTGLNGKSFIYRYKLGSSPEKMVTLDSAYFGEGIVLFDNKVMQLTWQTGIGFVYDLNTWNKIGEFRYGGEGWGFTHDGTNLIMSDGSNRLFYLDPKTFAIVKMQEVCDDKGKVTFLNELEYIDGTIYANIWQTDQIVKIEAKSGKVTEFINCEGLLTEAEIKENDVHELNGIAYDAQTKKIWITGKNWPKIFELKTKN